MTKLLSNLELVHILLKQTLVYIIHLRVDVWFSRVTFLQEFYVFVQFLRPFEKKVKGDKITPEI
jgi:hypothetical protein